MKCQIILRDLSLSQESQINLPTIGVSSQIVLQINKKKLYYKFNKKKPEFFLKNQKKNNSFYITDDPTHHN